MCVSDIIMGFGLLSWVTFIFFIVAWGKGYEHGKKEWQDKAIKDGHAEYYLDSNNKRQWRWKEMK